MQNWTEQDFDNYGQADWKFISEMKVLIDENKQNIQALERIRQTILAEITTRQNLTQSQESDVMLMNLQEYAYELARTTDGRPGADEWASEYERNIDKFIGYGKLRWANNKEI